MSYIDTFDHQFVGYFGHLPIYRPLVVHVGADGVDDEFSCGPDNLVIGGGGGEHPAIVVRKLDYVVSRFVFLWSSWCEDHDVEYFRANESIFKKWGEVSLQKFPAMQWSEVFEFAGWTVDVFESFAGRCRSAEFKTPAQPDEAYQPLIEEWLAGSIGEFLFFSLPSTVESTVNLFDDARVVIRNSIYRNVQLPAPGYPNPFGRKSSPRGVDWGNFAWKISES